MIGRRVALAIITSVLALACSCTTSRMLAVGSVPDTTDALARRHDVAGYTTRDGRTHPFEGYVEAFDDSLRFVVPPTPSRGLLAGRPGRTVVLHRDSVTSVQFEVTDATRTVFAVLGVASLVTLVALIGLAAAFNGHKVFF
jgi:hypothetical protein